MRSLVEIYISDRILHIHELPSDFHKLNGTNNQDDIKSSLEEMEAEKQLSRVRHEYWWDKELPKTINITTRKLDHPFLDIPCTTISLKYRN